MALTTRSLALGAGATVLVAALVFQQFGSRLEMPAAAGYKGDLARWIPEALPSWQVRDEPLGQNERVNAGVAEVLRFDDFIFRRYSKGEQSFSVYVAHWGRGKMPTRLVAEHTPDRCWVENGWTCDQRFERNPIALEGRALLPAEYRIFRSPGSVTGSHHVIFWLLVDGKEYDFGQHKNLITHAVQWWAGAFSEFARHRLPEHYFVRIASISPFESLWREPGFQTVMKSVADLGLWAPPG
jgi:hypothetical protein